MFTSLRSKSDTARTAFVQISANLFLDRLITFELTAVHAVASKQDDIS